MDDITAKLEKIPEPSDARYSCYDTGGVECEVGEFLQGLVRMMKPELVCELGTYHGTSDLYIASALKENGFGKLITIEYETINLQIAKERFVKFGLQDFIQTELISSLDYQPTQQFDIILSDTEPNQRYQEVVKYFPSLKAGGFLLIHDCPPGMCQTGTEFNGMLDWPYGPVPEQMKDWLKDGELVKFHFRTPRGLSCFYKPGLDDFRP